jgi:hypothetical protein
MDIERKGYLPPTAEIAEAGGINPGPIPVEAPRLRRGRHRACGALQIALDQEWWYFIEENRVQ